MVTRVSCVIPTRNRWSLLQAALASVRAAGVDGVEIIVVDDGSTDLTAEYGPQLPGVRYLRGPCRGASAARNAGAAAATGEWLAFLDDDDEWLPGKLGRQLTWLEEMGGQFGATGILVAESDGTRKARPGPPSGQVPWGRLLEANLVCTASVVMRRALFESVGGFDESLLRAEDWDLWLRAALQSSLYHLAEPWTVYHEHGSDKLCRDHEALDRDAITVQLRYLPQVQARWRGRVRRALADAWLRAGRAAWARGARGRAGADHLQALRWAPGYALRHLGGLLLGFLRLGRKGC